MFDWALPFVFQLSIILYILLFFIFIDTPNTIRFKKPIYIVYFLWAV